MRCIDCDYNNNCSVQEIAENITGCDGHSKLRGLKDGECQCECCKKIFVLEENPVIFPRANNPKNGLCFDCY